MTGPIMVSFSDLLQHGDNRKEFTQAVQSISRAPGVFERGLPYNLDQVEITYLATAIECSWYVQERMAGKPRFADRHHLLSFALDSSPQDGLIMEFGVATGATINQIAKRFPDKRVYGFDSFEGLPEDWTAGIRAGHFARKDLPIVPKNVELVVGYFDKVLPGFLEKTPGQLSLLHIDCDLYFSTQTVLSQLRERIVSGTIVVFDEYFNYPEWRRHEFRAFQEFVSQRQIKYEYIGLVPRYEQVAVRIL